MEKGKRNNEAGKGKGGSEYGRLFLIPSLLGDGPVEDVLPPALGKQLTGILHYVVEDLRTARRFLKKVDSTINIDALSFGLLNEHTREEDIPALFTPLLEGHDMGLISEAGTPCIADPGAALVAMAHANDVRVIPLTGPSSIILALMASGFNGQNFVFHGYLPVEQKSRMAAIKILEQEAYRRDQTQVFIETPYRNMKLLESILNTCLPETRLCIAANLTTDMEMIRTMTVAVWKKKPPAIHKQPAVFLLYK